MRGFFHLSSNHILFFHISFLQLVHFHCLGAPEHELMFSQLLSYLLAPQPLPVCDTLLLQQFFSLDIQPQLHQIPFDIAFYLGLSVILYLI